MSDITSEIGEIALEIESYLEAHPAAADTLEGIARFWLPSRNAMRPAHVQLALDYLASEHRILVRKSPSGTILYSAVKQPRDSA